ncbi:MAG TPA: hypothetical protein ENO03_00655 [Candidatus Aminicenantes bacterium]|nr:hypothetical protein [Candidatus Aminicenantes bacterium]
MIRKLSPLLALAVWLGAVGPAAAAGIRFELGFGWTLVGPAMSAAYVNQYKPTLSPPNRYVDSSASQTVRFNAKTTYGLNGFFNIFVTKNLGIQILADYHRPGLGGANDPYLVSMRFLTFGGTPETYARTIDWERSEGNLTETAFSLNALARFRVAENLSLSVSAGPSVVHFEGQAGHVGYTSFDLAFVEGEYQLTGGTYRTIVAFGPQTKYGLNAGVEAAYEAFRQVILAVDLRWYGIAKADLPLRIVEDPIYEVPTSEIASTIGLGSVRIDPSYIRAGLAIRFIF